MISGNVNCTFNPTHHMSIGNNLFLISTVCALAWKNNAKSSFPTLKTQCEYWKKNHENTIFRNVIMDDAHVGTKHMSKLGINCFIYEELVYENNLELNGFYFSHKYFDMYRSQLLNMFCVDDITKKYIYDKNPVLHTDNCVSIHVRKGDYKKTSERTNGSLYRLDISYYDNSINFINNKIHNPTYLIFTENKEDIHWCKKYIKDRFKNNNIIIMFGEHDYIDLYMMTLCKHNIIANSTFSWWGAYLNNNNDKIVIFPKGWLDSTRESNFFLSDWIGIEMYN